MINIQEFNVDSVVMDIVDIERIEAKKPFETDTPQTCYREIQFIDNENRVITIRLYAKNMKNLDIKNVE